MAVPDMLKFLWQDQASLNALFRPDGPPLTAVGKTELAKEMVLHMFSETDEFLRTLGAWKPHRQSEKEFNREAAKVELADIGKYWVTLCQLFDISAEEMFEASRRKSMVVRQRHTEEWVSDLNRASVIIDIDQVLADYVFGFLSFLIFKGVVSVETAHTLRINNAWVDHRVLNIPRGQHATLLHEFRTTDQHIQLPIMPGARAFLDWCRERNWQIILLTSRPIHEYPNLYGETLMWLTHHQLQYDRVWWARDKAEICLDRNIRDHIVFAVDDDTRYIDQYMRAGIPVYWMNKLGSPTAAESFCTWVPGLTNIIVDYEMKETEHERK